MYVAFYVRKNSTVNEFETPKGGLRVMSKKKEEKCKLNEKNALVDVTMFAWLMFEINI